MGASLSGRLLVATPSLVDPNFARTVVLICAHDEDGAFGVVLNRAAEGLGVADHLPDWAPHVAAPAVLFSGGPVERTRALAIARYRMGSLAGLETDLPHRLSVVDLAQPPEDAVAAIEALRVFVGYAGWGAGQLDREIKDEGWFVVEAEADDPFTATPDRLWHHVLRRQQGKLALFAYFPPDPTRN